MVGRKSEASKPCRRCKTQDAPLILRNDPTCQSCYLEFIPGKIGKRIAIASKETKTSQRPVPRRYIAGLSFGPSSTVLAHVLDGTARHHATNKSSTPFIPLVVHVDTDLSHSAAASDTPAQRRLALYRERYPNVSFECVHLSRAIALKTMNWSSLPIRLAEGDDDVARLRKFFDALPSVTSKADILRLLTRHILLDLALERSYPVLLLGHSTTALAALTLTEVANGRGYAVPWQTSDGPYMVCSYEQASENTDDSAISRETSRTEISVYYPLREVFKNEIMTFLSLTPTVNDLVASDGTGTQAVVSHKDQSIEEVMARYFDSVEGPYSGILANVVRTSGKLDRAGGGEFCHMCGMTLDEQGDSRWAGELGDDVGEVPSGGGVGNVGKLCYGCKRSIGG